jgi:anti-sigma28 factor (negative regulator of flagellin synthesis)
MISQTTSSLMRNVYTNNLGEAKGAKTASTTSKPEQATSSTKVDELKSAISSGEYKVDINALANKMADDLL